MRATEIFEKEECRFPVVVFQILHDAGSADSGLLASGVGETEPGSLEKRGVLGVHGRFSLATWGQALDSLPRLS
ncbi:hypothetical protein ACWGH8_13605 [Nonomuraea muscovyensis]|uniref:Uncharacterized protein n=1 Tax=Nonomuraea muscovyensis TaxID=1124761 RepID=A0A7X0EYF3_9ACTN|nr:hypothetical protein [Nonomuraea muscovyensis]MBB6346384.1 hypothetical protein [Nonomuraea muscovyensis]